MQLPQATATPPPAAALLQSLALAGERGERRLFQGLDLDLAPGSVTWLRGRNGRGKTTLLRLLAGLSSPAEGQILIQGQPQAGMDAELRNQWAYIGHQNALKDELTALEALRFLARLHKLPHDADALKLALQRLGLGAARLQQAPVRTLSQGQRRRVALARLALSTTARVWLLDEPFDALDSDGIQALNAVISAHAQAGGCVLLTSHQAISIESPVPAVLDLELFAPPRRPSRSAAQAARLAQAHTSENAESSGNNSSSNPP